MTLSGGEGVSNTSSNGTLEMTGAALTGSTGAGLGGAILNNGQLWATDSSFTNNAVTRGRGCHL